VFGTDFKKLNHISEMVSVTLFVTWIGVSIPRDTFEAVGIAKRVQNVMSVL